MCGFPLWPVLATLLAQTPILPSAPEGPIGIDPSGVPAAPPAPPISPPAALDGGPETRWYGAPAVVADVATVALTYVTVTYANRYQQEHDIGWSGATAAYTGLGLAYLLDGAVVHALNHQPRRAGESFVLRIGAVVVGIVAALPILANSKCSSTAETYQLVAPGRPDYCAARWPIVFGVPLVGMAIDDAFLARAPVGETPPLPARAGVAPTLVVRPGLALFGVGASF